ncbi:MAG: hypothetical protein EXS37_01625 [Opitutus sp.]|nr:hypothetical protein [Opitutus sp.]
MTLPGSQLSLLNAQLRAKRGGFALLIVITMLAFIVVLLVGLALYTRVETAVAGNTQRQAQARENALLGLNVALGQLQQHAGPDTRVTATAKNFGGASTNPAGTVAYTGVWSSDATASDTPGAPLTWLVSGNELRRPDTTEGAAAGSTVAAPLAITPGGLVPRPQTLVGANSTGERARSANWVDAPLVDLTAIGVPGAPPAAATIIGRYAWWVGDQGVKAPVAVPDGSDVVNFAPYGDETQQNDLGRRIRQQIALGAAAADATGEPVFEPRDTNNAVLVADQKVSSFNQLAFLRNAANAPIGIARVRQNFHTWSPNSFAVLADSKRGGLREDLSLNPGRLGAAFSAWARYDRPRAVAMEPTVQPTPVVGVDPPGPMPPYGADPLRRRFSITTNVTGGGLEGGIHPVLAFFGMSFSIRDDVAPNYEVSVRCVVGLWNPHASSLVPPAGSDGRLELHVTGLPDVRVRDNLGGDDTISLQSLMGVPLRFVLAWPDGPTREDEASWLPGRVYYWTAESNTTEPSDGNVMRYNERNATAVGGAGVVRSAGIAHSVPPRGVTVFRQCSVSNGDNTTLRVQLVKPAGSQQGTLATFESPRFRDFETSPDQLEADHKFVDFAYVFRLPDPAEIPEGETATWLSAAGRDPRRALLSGSAFVAGENQARPELYGGPGVTGFSTRYVSRLLDRATDSRDYNEDVPVFELPCGPFLSVGALQHLLISNARPFAIGNPWGTEIEVNGVPANALFDRFFFSGLVQDLVPASTAAGELILPNPLLKPLRKPDATKVTIEDIRTMVNPPDTTAPDGTVTSGGPGSAFSSKFFLQGGAFNFNSTSAIAWAAVLRSLRFAAPAAFNYLRADPTTGTAEATGETTSFVQSGDAQFFRFSQSAQETYQAEWPPASAESGSTPPRTDLFRRGMRTLSAAQVAALAGKIVELIGTKQTADGPFRSLEEFLSPSDRFAGVDADGISLGARSLLEAAIADAGINADIAEFSSQWLTQADVMTALAPILFPRSDTFIIRSYGEAVNPATNAREGQAWCEAIVQRVPEYFDPSDPPETPASAFDVGSNPDDATSLPTQAHQLNKLHGRRFKVVSFRWLTRSDI